MSTGKSSQNQASNGVLETQLQPESVPELGEKEARLFKILLKDDIRTFAAGNKSVFETGVFLNPLPLVTTADRLQNDYERNEVAGDQNYRGKEFIVNGKVASINRSLGDNYFISLAAGSNPFMQPQATMDNGYTGFLASLKKGQDISLFCKGGGMMMGSAMLQNCIPTEKWMNVVADTVFKFWPKLVKAKEKHTSALVIISYLGGKMLSDKSACLKDGSERACLDEITRMRDRMGKNEFFEAGKRFGIDQDTLALK